MNKIVIFCSICIMLTTSVFAQKSPSAENIIIITLDGLRWQEVFGGIDTVLAGDKTFNQGDSAKLMKQYWDADLDTRREKLMPFLWSTIEKDGRIYGNRSFGNLVNNYNPHWFSYPGYSEIFCGYVDTAINTNSYPPNPNTNVLAFLQQQPKFRGKVAAFGAWDAFDRILNEAQSGFPVVSGSDQCGGAKPSAREAILNDMKRDCYMPFGMSEQLDVFTHFAALEYLKNKRPKVLYIGYGETDEWAHHGHYRDYLNAARQTDAWIQEIWTWIQSDPKYRNKTALFITTDHGRGDKVKSEWTSHGKQIKDSNEIWFVAMGPGITPKGEMKNNTQIYQRQFAQTMANWLGFEFRAEHPVAEKAF